MVVTACVDIGKLFKFFLPSPDVTCNPTGSIFSKSAVGFMRPIWVFPVGGGGRVVGFWAKIR